VRGGREEFEYPALTGSVLPDQTNQGSLGSYVQLNVTEVPPRFDRDSNYLHV